MNRIEIVAQACLIAVSLIAGGLLLEKRFSPPPGHPAV